MGSPPLHHLPSSWAARGLIVAFAVGLTWLYYPHLEWVRVLVAELTLQSPRTGLWVALLVSGLVFAPWLLGLLGRWRPQLLTGARRHTYAFLAFSEAFPWLSLNALLFVAFALESLVDPSLTARLDRDYTPLIFSWEGNQVESVQSFLRGGAWRPLLDAYFTVSYVLVYLVLYAGLIAWYAWRRDDELLRPHVLTWTLIWLVGLPFYLFFPVQEPWITSDPPYEYARILAVLHDTVPSSASDPNVARNLNNEFPSLHAAFSIAAATVPWLRGRRLRAAAIAPFSLSVIVATIYLGLHWLLDVAAGLLLGLGAAWGGVWLAKRSAPGNSSPRT